NFHHTFANDYRNGIRWYQFDPTKWLIWTLHKLKLVHNLKRVDPATIKKRMVIEHKNLLLERLKAAWDVKKEEFEKQVTEISDQMLEKIQQFNQLKEKYNQFKEARASRDLILAVKTEIKNLKKSMKEDFYQMKELSRSIMKLPLPAAGH
ncbi:MAG TPA: acyl-CoA desaturase, partial [Parachlamydiaceae bacterium]|nr:acyl-CoA desaturase [Parachlamydiaceae bacterium]